MNGDFDIEPVDTGLEEAFTAAVNEPPALTPEGREALKALVAFPTDKLTPGFLAQVARDITMDIYTLDQVLTQHGLTHAQYDFLSKHNEVFKSTLQQLASEWHKIGSVQDRLRAQAAAALEAQLPTIAGRMGKQTEKLADTVEAAKLFAKIADVDSSGRPGAGASGERFEIVIDLGADQRIAVRSGSPPEAGDQSAGGGPLREIGQVQTQALAVPGER